MEHALTGFDSKTWNTPGCEDKNPEIPRLIHTGHLGHATNRILNDTKPYGNIHRLQAATESCGWSQLPFQRGAKPKEAGVIWLREPAPVVIDRFPCCGSTRWHLCSCRGSKPPVAVEDVVVIWPGDSRKAEFIKPLAKKCRKLKNGNWTSGHRFKTTKSSSRWGLPSGIQDHRSLKASQPGNSQRVKRKAG